MRLDDHLVRPTLLGYRKPKYVGPYARQNQADQALIKKGVLNRDGAQPPLDARRAGATRPTLSPSPSHLYYGVLDLQQASDAIRGPHPP